MDVSRNFMLSGTTFLVVGIGFGMHMGASGDHSFAPLHAHINLLGFVLSMIFALSYRFWPAMGESKLSTVHFWLHISGSLVLLVMLFLMFSGRIAEEMMFPLAPIAELAIFVGVVLFLVNAVKYAK